MNNHILGALRLRYLDRGRQYREIRRAVTEDAVQRTQERHMNALLLHAYHNAQYYRHIFNEVRLVQDGVVDLSKCDRVPVLTKDAIRQFRKELTSRDYTTRRWYYNTSGGSTGEPVRFIQDRELLKWVRGTEHYYFKDMLGIAEPTARIVWLWGSERDIFENTVGTKTRLINWATTTMQLNSFKMAKEDLACYIGKINAYKPDIVRGYARSLFELCEYARGQNTRLYSPKIVVSSAETLRDDMRHVIESQFRTKVYDFYGSRETPCLAAECKNGSMHVFSVNHRLEVLDNHNCAVGAGEKGKIVVTTLHNYSMPLIRYEIGDTAVQSDGACSCGIALPILKKVSGRISDHFVTENGTLIHGEYFTRLFYFKDCITKFQVIQEDYRQIRVLVVLKNSLGELEKRDIERKIRLVMGECTVIWEVVDAIPVTSSGKYLFVKSLVRH